MVSYYIYTSLIILYMERDCVTLLHVHVEAICSSWEAEFQYNPGQILILLSCKHFLHLKGVQVLISLGWLGNLVLWRTIADCVSQISLFVNQLLMLQY